MDDKRELLKLAAGDSRAIRIGDSVLYPPVMVGQKAFHFDPWQNGFLFYLQKHSGDMELACNKIGKPMEWAQKFISTRKFREFRTARINASAISNGALFDEWRETGIAGMRGYRDWYESNCGLCNETNKYSVIEAESFRDENMTMKASCKVCLQPVSGMEYKKEEYAPTREQVQFWSEIGARVSPKIERISHEFSSENFVFQEGDAA